MRGKNIDNEFVMSFIQECAKKGKNTPEDICEQAIERIQEIDKHLKTRVKLSDVLSFFGYKKKATHSSEKECNFTFSDIDQKLALVVFDNVYNKTIDTFMNFVATQNTIPKYKEDLIFTLKVLLATKILNRNSNNLIEDGENIKDYYESIS